jgi:hypothetical protein
MVMTITLRHENGKDRAECTTFANADSILRRWSDGCHQTLGYDKIDFTLVDAEHDLTYHGRYDLVHWSTAFAELCAHVARHLAYLAGTGRPRHMSEEQYAHAMKSASPTVQARAVECLAIIDTLRMAEMASERALHLDEDEESLPAPRM